MYSSFMNYKTDTWIDIRFSILYIIHQVRVHLLYNKLMQNRQLYITCKIKFSRIGKAILPVKP